MDQAAGVLGADAGFSNLLSVLTAFTVVYVCILCPFAVIIRLWLVMPARVRQGQAPPKKPARTRVRTNPASTVVVFGSGGHTKEMLTLLGNLSVERYRPLYFVRAKTDHRSEGMVRTSPGVPEPTAFFTIPRSREVLQSWLTTPFTTVRALWSSFWLVLRLRPELVLCNGPGTCLPICVSAFVLRFLGYAPTRIIFVESFCRVKSLSMTGRLLYYFADRFIVQWPGLQHQYKLVEYLGPIC